MDHRQARLQPGVGQGARGVDEDRDLVPEPHALHRAGGVLKGINKSLELDRNKLSSELLVSLVFVMSSKV